VLNDLLSDLPVPMDVDRVNHDAEAPKVAGRKSVQQCFVVIPTHAHIETQGLRHRTHRTKARQRGHVVGHLGHSKIEDGATISLTF
jgi:hypothetical protein